MLLKPSICSDYIKSAMCKDYNHKTHMQLRQYLGMVQIELSRFATKLTAKNIAITFQTDVGQLGSDSQALPWMLSATEITKDLFLPFYGELSLSGSPAAGLAINENWGAKAVIVPSDNMFCHAWLVPVVESDELSSSGRPARSFWQTALSSHERFACNCRTSCRSQIRSGRRTSG